MEPIDDGTQSNVRIALLSCTVVAKWAINCDKSFLFARFSFPSLTTRRPTLRRPVSTSWTSTSASRTRSLTSPKLRTHWQKSKSNYTGKYLSQFNRWSNFELCQHPRTKLPFTPLKFQTYFSVELMARFRIRFMTSESLFVQFSYIFRALPSASLLNRRILVSLYSMSDPVVLWACINCCCLNSSNN